MVIVAIIAVTAIAITLILKGYTDGAVSAIITCLIGVVTGWLSQVSIGFISVYRLTRQSKIKELRKKRLREDIEYIKLIVEELR